mgnify:CR=1 FL=1
MRRRARVPAWIVNASRVFGNPGGTCTPAACRTAAIRAGRSSIRGIVRGTSSHRFGESCEDLGEPLARPSGTAGAAIAHCVSS